MNPVWALVPAKSPERSKTRLQAVLQHEERVGLSAAMLRDVLTALDAAQHIAGVAILTDDDAVAAAAEHNGHVVIRDSSASFCAALDHAATELEARGVAGVLVMPADIPTVRAADIDALIERHDDGLSLCPAIRDGGTNAILCTPPSAVPFCFGHDSARKHLQAAGRGGVKHARLALPAFFRDIDLPDDLVWLNGQQGAPHTLDFLRQSGISARLGPAFLSASG